ncbi:MAG: hypothetical protein R3236_03225, partial [Phycisphaeraceae bacterium]|nr:hypothetical protein [Phycisphaeraceae bacterium]
MDESTGQATTSGDQGGSGTHPLRLAVLVVLLVVVCVIGYFRYQEMMKAGNGNGAVASSEKDDGQTGPVPKEQIAKAHQSLDLVLDRIEAFLDKHDRWPDGWDDLKVEDEVIDRVQAGFGFEGGHLYTKPDYLLAFIMPADHRIPRTEEQTRRILELSKKLKASFARRQKARPQVADGPIKQVSCPFRGLPINRGYHVDIKGLRIYTCCLPCLKLVKENPDQAIANLKSWGEQVWTLEEIKQRDKDKKDAPGTETP